MAKKGSKITIFCSEPEAFSVVGTAQIKKNFNWVEDLSIAQVLLIRVKTRVHSKLLDLAPKLRAVFTATTGTDHIDLAECERRGVEVFSLKGHRAFLRKLPNTTEHAFALLLALYRNLPVSFDAVKRGEWNQAPFRGHTLAEKEFCVVGYGRLGAIAAKIAKGFNMRVTAYDPHVQTVSKFVTKKKTLMQALKSADIISIHAALTPETEHLIGAQEFAAMKRSAVLINTARGQIVDEKALLFALSRGQIAGAGLDVLEDEASVARFSAAVEYARLHSNLVVTSHIGGQTFEAVEAADLFTLERMLKWAQKKRI